jgi:hypothetical protein
MISRIKYFVPLAILITGLSDLVYLTVQQDIRIGSYEPQIQLSEDTASRIANNEDPKKVFPPGQIDISKSVAPYLIVYDDKGNVLASNAILNNQVPKVPQGVLDYAKTNGQDRISWQPEVGVRSAIIVTHFSNPKISGSVLSGRSLREPEKRIEMLGAQVALVYLIIILTTFITSVVFIPGVSNSHK